MNGLKYLIKAIICNSIILTAFSANAQILGIGVDFEKLNLPSQFYQSLETCQAYTYTQPIASGDVSVSTTYTVEPEADGMCRLYVDGVTNISVHIIQECHLTAPQAKAYAEALRKYQSKGYSPRWDSKRIETDEHYLAAYDIMSDRKICKFKRDKIDHTQLIRENLQKCTAAEQVETTATTEVKRQIVNKENDNCIYNFILQNRNPETSEATDDHKQIVFECRLSEAQIGQYLRILETMVIPEEEGYDFSTVQRLSPLEEMNFILDNCTLRED